MIKVYTVKNTVEVGLIATVMIGGKEVTNCDMVVIIGPIVIARMIFFGQMTKSTGKFCHSYRFGRGSVTITELPK